MTRLSQEHGQGSPIIPSTNIYGVFLMGQPLLSVLRVEQ